MSELGLGAPLGHFTTEMGFSHQIDEGLARGSAWHTPELSVPGTAFPHPSVMLLLADVIRRT